MTLCLELRWRPPHTGVSSIHRWLGVVASGLLVDTILPTRLGFHSLLQDLSQEGHKGDLAYSMRGSTDAAVCAEVYVPKQELARIIEDLKGRPKRKLMENSSRRQDLEWDFLDDRTKYTTIRF